ncbi:hypothetical protein LAZ67_17002471 [Cordylochernes scorpioides]|uniref:Histone-lysine N-methyltransferase SETMAR n=1 Tax=Cordylochernes scorpioides TaxID=51811 RepID=A0ABY6LDZ5_9ARAC|nr:hypothetical protein LAZ67_17002471 [Cordylochernes scorpioides]
MSIILQVIAILTFALSVMGHGNMKTTTMGTTPLPGKPTTPHEIALTNYYILGVFGFGMVMILAACCIAARCRRSKECYCYIDNSWSNKQEKAKMFKSKLKCLLITLFHVKGLVHYEFVPECQTINQHYYLDVLRHLREPVRQKRHEKWHQENWLLHHDNARPHTAVTVQLYLAKHGIALLPTPPYSPDLLPTTFSFTLKLKES